MSELQGCTSAILYQNTSRTVTLIDIPTSIVVAQRLAEHNSNKLEPSTFKDGGPILLSCDPLQHPYPKPPEPKSEKSRNRILAQIPSSQQRFHSEIVPIISNALQEIRERHHANWCLPRHTRLSNHVVQQGDSDLHERNEGVAELDQEEHPPKRKRNDPDAGSPSVNLEEPTFISTNKVPSQSCCYSALNEPPLILSPGINQVPGLDEIQGIIVQNPTRVRTVLNIKSEQQPCTTTGNGSFPPEYITVNIPPESTFINCHLTPPTKSHPGPIPALSSDTKFNFILMDPPWPNRSVRRSSHYKEHAGPLQPIIEGTLRNHLHPQQALVAIWITNSLKSRFATLNALDAAGLHPFEEWVWVKTTTDGQPAWPLDGLWRRPYEVLILAHREKHVAEDNNGERHTNFCEIRRRVIVAVADIHSRKPNLKELIENIFFSSPAQSCNGTSNDEERHLTGRYSGLEVFARNLTAGWWACGNEVIRYNWKGWWAEKKNTENDA
ncbi:hypothetical protein RJZ56_006276 [Blastomyces dermatitidis]|uniref:MT-A70 family protein n=1 Tax=Ajellomyces dermatitidis (strain ER-3 / ATCC MYA-2586) TaxID=559297 RepID=A0ABP2EJM1_AJEDR|nr:MT-A70 family protein [Blastomyces dermatitidis ER-3]EEQ83267.1 MT-A70 family protein [Blastomyces dermatitidis ER-3]